MKLPKFFIEPFQDCRCVLDIFLRLLPHVKDGTVFARTQDILEYPMSRCDRDVRRQPVPGVAILDIAGTESTILRIGLAYATWCSLAFHRVRGSSVDSCCRRHHLGLPIRRQKLGVLRVY